MKLCGRKNDMSALDRSLIMCYLIYGLKMGFRKFGSLYLFMNQLLLLEMLSTDLLSIQFLVKHKNVFI